MFLEDTQQILEYVGEKLKLINNIINEILPAEAATEYKPRVRNWVYKMTSLDWDSDDDYSYEAFIAPRMKNGFYPYEDENSALQNIITVLGDRVFDYYHKCK